MQSWLCPDDRQLRLRACIARGWSTPRDAVAALTPAECAALGDVLRRDHALRLLDRGRVRRAADAVEKLRLAQRGDGSDTCRLCACRLRHRWWRPSGVCADCGCRFCGSCAEPLCGDDWLCKLCKEVRLLKAKSGAWFRRSLQDNVAALSVGGEEPSEPEEPSVEVSRIVTSLSMTSSHRGAGAQPPVMQKSLSHCDLLSRPPAAAAATGAEGERRRRRLPHCLRLGGSARRKSASCSQIGHQQSEYFPNELNE